MAVAHLALTTNRRPSGRSIRRRRRATVTSLVAATAWLAGGCGLFSGGGVVLVGDSLTMVVAEPVAAAAPDLDVTRDADWGLRIDQEIASASAVARRDPDHVIINLGTNNVLQGHDLIASAMDLTTIVDEFDRVPCVHLVTINQQMQRLGQDTSAAATALNEHIRSLAATRPNVELIDWNQIVVDHAADGIMDPDTVHPNSVGVAMLTDAYVRAMRSC